MHGIFKSILLKTKLLWAENDDTLIIAPMVPKNDIQM